MNSKFSKEKEFEIAKFRTFESDIPVFNNFHDPKGHQNPGEELEP